MKNKARADEVKATEAPENERITETEVQENQAVQSKRVRDRGSFSRFEAKHHLIGNIVVTALIIVLALLCLFSTVQIKLPDTADDEPRVEQSMIDLATAFSALFMSQEDENAFIYEYRDKWSEIYIAAQEKYPEDRAAQEKYAAKELSKTEYAKFLLIVNKNGISGEVQEDSSLIGVLENYIGFGTVIIGIACCVPMALAVLSAAILLIKALFILIFRRNGKNLHVVFPLINTFVILAMVMMSISAYFVPSIFIYAIFVASFVGMLLSGAIRYVTYPNKFMARGLIRYIVMQVGVVVAFCMSLTDALVLKVGEHTTNLSFGQFVFSGILTSHLSGGFDPATWIMPLVVEIVMLLATFIMGCIMASKMYTVGNRWRKRQWKARNELTAMSALFTTGFMAGFGYLYTFLYNNYIKSVDGLVLELNFKLLIAPVILLIVFIFLLILRPVKRQRKAPAHDDND